MDISEKRKKKLEYQRKWMKANPEKVIAYRKKHRNNKEKAKKWAKNNPDKIKEYGKRSNKKRYEENPEKHRRRSREYYHNNKLKVKISRIKRDYGMSFEEYENMIGTSCPICGKSFGESAPCIDHDHKTNQVRGILCSTCNMALGLLNDDISIFFNAITYLKKEKDNG